VNAHNMIDAERWPVIITVRQGMSGIKSNITISGTLTCEMIPLQRLS